MAEATAARETAAKVKCAGMGSFSCRSNVTRTLPFRAHPDTRRESALWCSSGFGERRHHSCLDVSVSRDASACPRCVLQDNLRQLVAALQEQLCSKPAALPPVPVLDRAVSCVMIGVYRCNFVDVCLHAFLLFSALCGLRFQQTRCSHTR